MTTKPDWWVYEGTGTPHDGIDRLPEAPPWRAFRHGTGTLDTPQAPDNEAVQRHLGRVGQGVAYQAGEREIHLVNLALHLRRPLLLTGKPGTGKSTLAYAVAHELKLGPVLRWPITSRSTLKEGLYEYDAVGRLYDAGLRNAGALTQQGGKSAEPPEIGKYMWLGPLGTALLPWRRPRVLLIDEIDKSDMDFPNDLLNVFEEGEFGIRELARLDAPQTVTTADHDSVEVVGGEVACAEFPFVVLTSNEEREFPMAFLRRCIRLEIGPADDERLSGMVAAHLGPPNGSADARPALIAQFLAKQREKGALANDQLLNALLMAERGVWGDRTASTLLDEHLLRPLDRG